MSARDCPDCDTRLQPLWLPASKGGEEVELDRCNDCGGVWFDAGELSDATRRSVQASAEQTDRRCPACDVPLLHGVMSGGVDVETCAECKGTFLEARDLDAIVKKKAPRAEAPGGTGFVCEACGERKPFSLAQPTLSGLECEGCVKAKAGPPPEPERVARAGVFGKFLGWLRGEE
jgi:hypothetical protein